MPDEEAVEELLDFPCLRRAQLEAVQGGPVFLGEFVENLPRAGREFAFRKVGRLAEVAQQLHLKREKGERLRRQLRQRGQQIPHQRKHSRQRRVRFGGLLNECGGVTRLLKATEFRPQSFVRSAQADFAERVEFGAAAALEAEVGFVKQIQLAAKSGFGPACTFRYGGDAPQLRREPVDDEAGLGERTRAEDDAGGGCSHR